MVDFSCACKIWRKVVAASIAKVKNTVQNLRMRILEALERVGF